MFIAGSRGCSYGGAINRQLSVIHLAASGCAAFLKGHRADLRMRQCFHLGSVRARYVDIGGIVHIIDRSVIHIGNLVNRGIVINYGCPVNNGDILGFGHIIVVDARLVTYCCGTKDQTCAGGL